MLHPALLLPSSPALAGRRRGRHPFTYADFEAAVPHIDPVCHRRSACRLTAASAG
jgi:hypothetical protein